jgi:cobalt-zinc-cadmium efflux system membrane fusion protein
MNLRFPSWLAVVVSPLLLLQGCSRGSAADAGPSVTTAPNGTVELTAQQQGAVMIATAIPHRFAIQTHALGNIGFDEDLPILQAESAVIGAAATFELTGKELARVRDLAGSQGGIALKELEQATSDQQNARSTLQAARAALRDLGESDDEIDRLVASGKTSGGSGSGKWAIGYLPESDSAALKIGQPVDVTVAMYPDVHFQGRITRVYPVLDTDTHRTKFRARLSDAQNRLRAGMLADVVVQVGAVAASSVVPAAAVVREGDGSTIVWVTGDGRRYVQRAVTTGVRQEGYVQIVTGLMAGEQVAADGALFLSNLLEAPPTE